LSVSSFFVSVAGCLGYDVLANIGQTGEGLKSFKLAPTFGKNI
jgi:hypothetical protein